MIGFFCHSNLLEMKKKDVVLMGLERIVHFDCDYGLEIDLEAPQKIILGFVKSRMVYYPAM